MRSAILKLRPELIFPLLISVFISLYFFYIDEAKNSFAGIFEFTNLFFLVVYAFFLFGIQKLIQMGLEGLDLTRNLSILVKSMLSAIILFALLFMFFIIIS